MTRYKYQSFAKDGNGAVIDGATVSVFLAGGTTAADVYEAASGGSSVNSVTSGSNGGYAFWVEVYEDGVGYTGEQLFKTVASKSNFGSSTIDEIDILPHLYAGTGTTANRPVVTTVGMYYIDTDIAATVYWNGSGWVSNSVVSDADPTLSNDLKLNGNGFNYNGADVVTNTEVGYLDGVASAIQTQIDACVKDTGNEAIAGIKTFSSFPISPAAAPTTDYQFSNKKYIDDSIANKLDYTLATKQASTSGTSIDFTSIPAGTKRITIMFVGVSTNGTSHYLFQLGDSGGVETSGYLGAGYVGGGAGTNYTAGFGMDATAAGVVHGQIILSLFDATTFTWVASGQFARSNAANVLFMSGSKPLSAELDRVRVTTVNGTDAFDAGEININYES